jgi:hypothetical protein
MRAAAPPPPWRKTQTNVDTVYCERCRVWLKGDPMVRCARAAAARRGGAY